MYYYRVPVVKDAEGIRPDVPAPFAVVEYLDDDTVIIARSVPLEGATPLTAEELNTLVRSPMWKVIKMGDKLYSFRLRDGCVPIGITRDGIIGIREEQIVEVPIATDASGNVLETRKVRRVTIREPEGHVKLAVRNDRLEVVEQSEEGLRTIAWWEAGRWLKEVTDEEGNVQVVDASETEVAHLEGGVIRLKDVVVEWR